ncbi:MAG: hypothetical protein V5A87_06890 [Candidatus Bipolaricaulota bacterium]
MENLFLTGCLNGKRLGPFHDELILFSKRSVELDITYQVEKKMGDISPATVDRLPKPVKIKINFQGNHRRILALW